jgi:hypothetical protein
MLIGIMGKMGTGKTLSMTVLGYYLHRLTKTPLFSNYQIYKNKATKSLASNIITSVEKIWDMDTAIFLFDELWLTLDSRLWQDNVKLTRWINQTRKKKLLVFYTTQHIRQVELRVRKATDILIYCQKEPEGIWLTFIDYQYQTIGKKYLLANPSRFYDLYDTFEVLQALTVSKQYNNKYSSSSKIGQEELPDY